MPALGVELVVGAIQRALQLTLHRGHVVDRLGHAAGDFLDPGEAVELQRVKSLLGVARQRQARLHLGFGLQLHVAQLQSQALQVGAQLGERAARGGQRTLYTGAADHDFAGFVDQSVQHIGGHTQGGARLASARRCGVLGPHQAIGRALALRWAGRGDNGNGLGQCWRFRLGSGGDERCRNRTQLLPRLQQCICFALQPPQIVGCGVHRHGLHLGFERVHLIGPTQGSCQTGAAFECVQQALHFSGRAAVVRVLYPMSKRCEQAWHQLGRLGLEHWEEIGIWLVVQLSIKRLYWAVCLNHSLHGCNGRCGRWIYRG